MNTSTQILPGIKFIGYVDIDTLPDAPRIDLAALCNMTVGIFTEIHPIDFFGSPDCRASSERVAGQSSETATLKFKSKSILPALSHIGFVITDIEGNNYFIGNQRPPFPTLKVDTIFGSPDGDSAGFDYEIKHTALKSIAKCKI
ncbi:MAG: hypothetical protein HDS21_00185 [Bacteroides sp.]|nr:hypothetical protein [Bacteroides sp.]